MHEICIRVRLSDGQTSSLSLSLEGGQATLDEGEGEIQNNDEDNSPNQLPFPSRSRQWEWCAGSTRTALSHAPARQKLCPLYCWRDGYLSVQEETPAFARSCCLSRQQHLKKERKKEKKTQCIEVELQHLPLGTAHSSPPTTLHEARPCVWRTHGKTVLWGRPATFHAFIRRHVEGFIRYFTYPCNLLGAEAQPLSLLSLEQTYKKHGPNI